KAEILRPLANVETQRRFPLTALTAAQQSDAVLDLQSAEARCGWGVAEQIEFKKSTAGSFSIGLCEQFRLLLPLEAEFTGAVEDVSRLRTVHVQPAGNGSLIENLHQHRRETVLLNAGGSRSAGSL